MKSSLNASVAATLIATAVGLGAWFFGIDKNIWPSHPQVADLVLSMVVCILVKEMWPVQRGQKKSKSSAFRS